MPPPVILKAKIRGWRVGRKLRCSRDNIPFTGDISRAYTTRVSNNVVALYKYIHVRDPFPALVKDCI